MVALGQAGHALADGGDDPGTLVAEDHRRRLWDGPVEDRQVRVTDPGGDDLDLDLTGAGLTDLEAVDDLEGVVTGVAHERSTHGCLLGFGE